jgi:putative ATP-dependent endonuclease of OLD family
MILKRIHIENFRSIRIATIDVGSQAALLGSNGTGKSTVLRALERFYGSATTVEMDDFFGRHPAEIVIGLTFHQFNSVERELFAGRIYDEEMSVARIFDPNLGRASGSYFGVTSQHSEFSALRRIDGATDRKNRYTQLRDSEGIYAELPQPPRAAAELEPVMRAWETAHPEHCSLERDDGRFFGFTNVANGALQRATSFVFIPALRDVAADAQDARGSVIAKLLELVVKNVIQQRADFRQWKARVSAEYRQITDPQALPELSQLSTDLTETLQVFYGQAGVHLDWQPAEDFAVPLPLADVQLDEDGFIGPVSRKGHGLQRAFILTLLQHLAKASARTPVAAAQEVQEVIDAPSEEAQLPGLILAIEEPELYQHPTKQRHFARVLSELSSGALPGVAAQTQVLFASHSPLFVSMDRFDEIKLAKRMQVVDQSCKECFFTVATLDRVAARLQGAFLGRPGQFTADGLRARLHIMGPELAEGFFADLVVLVEGPGDRAAVLAAAALRNIDLGGMGIAVLSADGKNNLDRPYLIFQELGIPAFPIWDCDDAGSEVINKALQRICGVAEEVLIVAADVVGATYACFERKLEVTLRAELTQPEFDRICAEIRTEFGIPETRDLLKSPFAVTQLLARASAAGRSCATLDRIVTAIVNMRRAPDR